MLQTEQCDKFGVYQNPDTEKVRRMDIWTDKWTCLQTATYGKIGTEINELKRQKHSDG